MCASDFFQPILCEFILFHSSSDIIEINGILCLLFIIGMCSCLKLHLAMQFVASLLVFSHGT